MNKSSLNFITLLISLLFYKQSFAQQQNASIKGHITTSDNKPAEYVSVILNDKGAGTLTNANGDYVFHKLRAGNYLIRVSAVGLSSQSKTIDLKNGEARTADFMLNENARQLKEVNINASKNNKFIVKQSETVGKIPLTQLENPQVYTSISKDLMTEQLVFSVDDAIRNAPGIQMMWQATSRSGDGGSYYNSRGFIVQSQFRNGLAGIITSTNDAANIDKVEVVKGPSATLFGSAFTSYGGLINRTTKKPFDTFGGEVAYSAGSYGFNRLSVDINTPLDPAKKVLFRLNAAGNYKGSFQDAGFKQSIFIAPSLSYQATKRLSFSFDAELSYGKGTGDQFIFFDQSVAALGVNSAEKVNIDYKKAYFSNDLIQNSQSNNFYGQAVYKISDQWISQTNFSASNSYSNGHGPYFYLVPKDSLSRNDQATRNSKAAYIEAQQNFNGDFKIGGLRNRFVGGLDFTRINSQQFFYGATLPKNISTIGQPSNYYDFNRANLDAEYAKANPYGYNTYPYGFRNNTYSAYVSDVLNITDNLLASAGVRIDRFDNQTSAYKQTAYSPKFGLVYQPIKDVVSLFANYQNGFVNQNGTDFNGKSFKPEQANQTEGGVKLDAFGGKLSSTLSYYYIEVKDILRADPAHANFSIQNGTQLSKGLEAEVIANPFEGFNVVAGFGYNDSRYINANADVDGRRPSTASSPYNTNLWLSYRIMHGYVKGLGFGVGGNYASENHIVNSASLGVFSLPSYTVLNASTFYDLKKYRFGLKCDNFTNKKYWIGYTTMNPQQLISVVGSIAYKF
ncbi:TonB-dependent receptor [Mucilaginibacter arboris]|uniref:TonB-dependent receptor n=1 Tax=Mucilaginibacter arboris TaxID=2682090 RepID=A0A7K1T0V2_9SPHI|nr:TonB-dependent receptor [Mucilaginibacter arboris]MVN22910.1 TonB-dependent receptor [Mucilaginibacter arboris]